uniref:GAGA-binding transcriptional activator n=1 Tax=Kalanchoe fedtschenkoi TaxID=63787 RepID=A0A7N0VLR9_KALFE
MDKGGPGRLQYGLPKGEYKPFQDQVQQRPSMKDIMVMVSERDSAFLERNLALSEKKAVLAQRDMAVFERDAAIAERDFAIKERDRVMAHLQLLENITDGDTE